MKQLAEKEFKEINAILARMNDEYEPWRPYHRDLAEFILPHRYSWLNETSDLNVVRAKLDSVRNKKIIDSTGTKAARDLAAGMLNGVASPARMWFNIRMAGFADGDKVPIEVLRWLEEVRRRMLLIMAESNFYNSFAMLLLDLVVFGTAGVLVYEDWDDVIRLYNLPVGEFRLAQDDRRDISIVSRIEILRVEQIVEWFGEENCSRRVRELYKKGGADLFVGIRIGHLIEPNRKDGRYIESESKYREFYWELTNNDEKKLLKSAIYEEKPGGFPRWEVVGNDTYGLSPGMDALGDIIQLQHEQVRKGEALDKMTDPPLVIDGSLRNGQGSTQSGGKLYVPSFSQVGAKPVYQVNLPLAELSMDIRDVQGRIKDTFFNDLFRMISQLETVRTATEIDARREEKLILMGAVLERLENEALDPIMVRIYNIMARKGLMPPPPPGFEDKQVEIQYVSILSDAQRAAGTGVIERFMQIIANVTSLVPEAQYIPDWHELLRDYAQRLSVPPAGINPRQVSEQKAAQAAQAQQAQAAADTGATLADAAKNLSQTDVGAGQSAFQAMLG